MGLIASISTQLQEMIAKHYLFQNSNLQNNMLVVFLILNLLLE